MQVEKCVVFFREAFPTKKRGSFDMGPKRGGGLSKSPNKLGRAVPSSVQAEDSLVRLQLSSVI